MATPLEVAARAIDGFRAEVTGLQRRLQEERDITAAVVRAKERVEDERDAAIKRADGNYRLYQELRHETDKAIRAAEQAIEQAEAAEALVAAYRKADMKLALDTHNAAAMEINEDTLEHPAEAQAQKGEGE